jgi:hypothetical protein
MKKKLRYISFDFEPYIEKSFGKRCFNINLINFHISNSRGDYDYQKWHTMYFYFVILNFTIRIAYEI